MLLQHEAHYPEFSTPRAFHPLSRFAHRAALIALILIFSTGVVVRAQNEAVGEDADIIRVRTDLVTVPLFVTDRSGRRVSGLTQADFSLQVGDRNLKLEYFAAGTERVALAFALDASGSAREIIRRQSEAALMLLSRFGPKSRLAVWHFGLRPRLIVDFKSGAGPRPQAFNLSAAADERTAIFDAAAAAVRAFDRPEGDPLERRILILISDGLDTSSQTRPQTVISEAVRHAVSIYVIHLPLFTPRDGRLQPRPPAKGFRSLAEATGGRYFMVGDARAALDPNVEVDLSPVFKAIEEDLRGQYVLGFYPDEASRGASFHRLSISLPDRRHRQLRVRQLRAGYTLKQGQETH